jgi:hypothetical protein
MEAALLVSYAKSANSNTSIGLRWSTLKYIYQEIDESGDSGVGFDVGVLHSIVG